MKRITTLLLTAGILLLSAVPNGAAGQERKTGKNDEGMGKVQHITKAEFLQKVYNYEANPQTWKYEARPGADRARLSVLSWTNLRPSTETS